MKTRDDFSDAVYRTKDVVPYLVNTGCTLKWVCRFVGVTFGAIVSGYREISFAFSHIGGGVLQMKRC